MEKTAKKPEEWGVSFLLTTNYNTLTEMCFDNIIHKIGYKVTGAKTAVEVGKSGNLHTHIYINFERSQRKSCLIKKLPTTDVKRIASGTEKTVIEYIGNKDKEVSKGCEIIDCWQYGDIETTQGTRTDLTATDNALWQIKDAIDKGESLRYLYNTFFPYMVRNGQGIKAYYEYVRQENAAEKAYKLETEKEHAIAEAEEILLLAIKEKNAIHRDLSNPICECGNETEWDSIDRRFYCAVCENEKTA